MLRISDPRQPERISRRTALYAGGLGVVGMTLPQLLAAESQQKKRSKSAIVIVPWGGPAQMDTLDPKPEAPDDVRSEIRPIATTVPGLHLGEHFPELARLAEHFAVVRSMTHTINTHNSATHYFLTGRKPAVTNRELMPASREDWPSLGSLVAKVRPAEQPVPSYVQLPLPLIDNGVFSGGQHAGFLSPVFDPFVIRQDPSRQDFQVTSLSLLPDLDRERLVARRRLAAQLDLGRFAVRGSESSDVHTERAFDLLTSATDGGVFDLTRERTELRERYGLTRLGQSMLLARRLVEAGVRLVLVCDTTENTNGKWDTHGGDYAAIGRSIRETDKALSALLVDLRERGLIDDTVVAWMAEFGRTPKVKANGGRDHWPHVYSLLLAGAGIRGGAVIGSSDSQGAYPKDHPVAPEDILATIYERLGINPHPTILDPSGRPFPLCDGKPVKALV